MPYFFFIFFIDNLIYLLVIPTENINLHLLTDILFNTTPPLLALEKTAMIYILYHRNGGRGHLDLGSQSCSLELYKKKKIFLNNLIEHKKMGKYYCIFLLIYLIHSDKIVL